MPYVLTDGRDKIDRRRFWLTPPDVYARLNAEFHFDFDPCPHPLPEGFDGLTCEWGQSNFVNPPYGAIIHQGKKKGFTAWIRKALLERQKGKLTVVIFPIDNWITLILEPMGIKDIRNLGLIRFHAIEDGSLREKAIGRPICAIILRPSLFTQKPHCSTIR